MKTEHLKFEEGLAISKLTGERISILRAICPNCGSAIWHVFDVGGEADHHLHLECRNCHTSFCDKGDECGLSAQALLSE